MTARIHELDFPLMWRQLKTVLEMIRFEHTVFALPFAFPGALLASDGLPGLWQSSWIIVAMVGVRSAAMAFNRIVDVEFDKLNYYRLRISDLLAEKNSRRREAHSASRTPNTTSIR